MLYIMRHGKTDWNDKGLLQGRTDIPLNEAGRAMARQAALECRDVHFDICYVSPLKRARETAELVLAGRDVPIVPDGRLIEMSFGICEGKPYGFKDMTGSPIAALFLDAAHYTDPPEGAESLDELYERTGSFLEEVALPGVERGLDILIVGHGAMNSGIISRLKNLPRKDFWSAGIENCKLKRLL